MSLLLREKNSFLLLCVGSTRSTLSPVPCPHGKLGILTEGHFDNKWLGWYSGGASPIFKKHVQGQEW